MDETTPEKRYNPATWAVHEVDQLLGRLARYTRFVVFSKWFLMLFAVGLMTTLIAVPLISKDRSGIRVSFVDSGVAGGKKNVSNPVMNGPVYSGSSEKGDQFKVTGTRATQITSTLIKIEQVEAQMIAPNGSWRSLTAAEADYDQTAKTIVLTGEVTLLDEQGYNFTTELVNVNLNTMEAEGNRPIQGVGPLGNLLASSFKIMDSGKRIIFYGGTQPLKLKIERKAKNA